MSGKYIVRQPIKDRENQIVGYEILYHGGNQAFGDPAESNHAAADTIYHFLLQNTSKVLKGSLNFMTFTTDLLMKKTPKLFDRSELIIQIDDSVIIHPLAMHFIQQYASGGYKIAVNQFQFAPRYLALLDTIDYIKLDMGQLPEATLRNIIEIAHSMHKQCIAVEVNNAQQYQLAHDLGIDYLEGTYVAERLATKAHTSSYLQGNFFRLMVAVTRGEPDVDEIVHLISMDATLTYALLRLVNSCYFALRHRATTVHQAIMILGLGQLKQWIYLLSASNRADGGMEAGAEEFLKLSFLRGSFCSELAVHAKDVPLSKSDAYLMGMFSTLNYLIDAPLEEILAEVPVTDEVKQALLGHEGRAGLLFDLALSYERADWQVITQLAEQLGIPGTLLVGVYFSCMEEVNQTWAQLTDPNPLLEEETERPENT